MMSVDSLSVAVPCVSPGLEGYNFKNEGVAPFGVSVQDTLILPLSSSILSEIQPMFSQFIPKKLCPIPSSCWLQAVERERRSELVTVQTDLFYRICGHFPNLFDGLVWLPRAI